MILDLTLKYKTFMGRGKYIAKIIDDKTWEFLTKDLNDEEFEEVASMDEIDVKIDGYEKVQDTVYAQSVLGHWTSIHFTTAKAILDKPTKARLKWRLFITKEK